MQPGYRQMTQLLKLIFTTQMNSPQDTWIEAEPEEYVGEPKPGNLFN